MPQSKDQFTINRPQLRRVLTNYAKTCGCDLQSALRDFLTELRYAAIDVDFEAAAYGSGEVFEEETSFPVEMFTGQ